jgi:serine/threonine-protein kinase
MRSCPHCSTLQNDALGFCPADGSPLGASDPLLGKTLSGQFILKERIGQGGCGDVYRAHQIGVERPVAVKLLHASAARQPEFAARFAREARAAARLSHPNIVTVFQLGRSEEGMPYIAMEWADAEPIGRSQPLTHDETLQAAVQIASALCEAHEAGIIHRDLKPENVLVGRRGGKLHTTLVDFGIAKIVNAELIQSGETHLTRHGVVYGTPQYLSPEQAGDQPLDARADLYSFGVMLYELFAGRLPFDSNGMALLVDHLSAKPKHLAWRVPSIDPRVASLVMRLLAKKPSKRPSSARVVLEELQAIVRTPDPEAMPAANDLHHARPVRPARARVGLMVALLLWLASSSSLGATDSQPAAAPAPVAMARAAVDSAEALPVDERGSMEPQVAPKASHSVPQRALLVSSSGYSLRLLMPEYVAANTEHALAIEIWDSAGVPVRSDALVLVFTDGEGQEQGVSVPAGAVPGRYEIDRSFAREGTHVVQVLPDRAGVSLRVHFEVDPEGDANT